MASYTALTLHATADDLSVTDWNAVANNTTFLYQKPYCNFYNSVSVAMSVNTTTQMSLGGTTSSGYGFSVSSNNVIMPLTGVYWVAFSFGVGVTTAGNICVGSVQHNGTTVAYGSMAQTLTTSGVTSGGATVVTCQAGDTIGLYGVQSAGTIGSTNAATSTYVALTFVGSL